MCKKRKFYKKLLANVEESGFVAPPPIQRQAIPLLLKKREVMCVAPTGSISDSSAQRKSSTGAFPAARY